MKRTYTYFGVIASKKNSKQIIKNPRTGRPMIISSKQARENACDMASQLMGQLWSQKDRTPLKAPLRVQIDITEPDHRRRDLDNQATSVLDALVGAGILTDDSNKVIIELQTRLAGFDKNDPHADIIIEEA